jgi:Ser-tRNA(Ala) deacylase AlaX
MVRKLFWLDAYCTAHKTRISAVDNQNVRVEETIFFAFSGGQESDAGSVAGIPSTNIVQPGTHAGTGLLNARKHVGAGAGDPLRGVMPFTNLSLRAPRIRLDTADCP